METEVGNDATLKDEYEMTTATMNSAELVQAFTMHHEASW
jgi:hypothetical protein